MNTKIKSTPSQPTQPIMPQDIEDKRRKIFKVKKN